MGLFGSKSDDNSKDVFSRLGKEVKEDMMVNTLEDNDLAKLAAGMKSELTGSESRESITDKLEAELNNESEAIETFSDSVAQDEPRSELEQMAEETAVITAGLVVSGDLDSVGSIDVFGTVEGNVACCGKLTVSGTIEGAIMANEVFANNAKISGDIQSKGSAKIGQGTVVIGNITATSAVIAGAVKGNVDINGPVVIDSSAVIVGDIKSKSVQINNGATIDGRCSQCYADVDTSSIFDIKAVGKHNKDEIKSSVNKETAGLDSKSADSKSVNDRAVDGKEADSKSANDRAVDGPPRAVQHLIEVGGVVAHDGQTSRQSGVDVGVGVDEGRHDDAAPGIDAVGVGVLPAQGALLTYLHDLAALVGHGAVLVIALALRVTGDESAVDDQIHDVSSFYNVSG